MSSAVTSTIRDRAAGGRWRKISTRMIVGNGIRGLISEAGTACLLSALRNNADPVSLLAAVRRNPNLSSEVYPTFGEISTVKGPEKIPALVPASAVHDVPLKSLPGSLKGEEISFRCLGNSYEADARRLILLSATLRTVPKDILSEPVKLINWLVDHRAAVAAECGRKYFSLGYLMQGLSAAGKIPLGQTYHRLAGGRDLFDHSPALQAVPEEISKAAVSLIGWLRENREQIKTETKSKNLALDTLIDALQAAGRIPLKQSLNRLATARDLYDRSPTLQDIQVEILNDPIKVINWLDKNRERIRTETGSDRLALATLVLALHSAGRIPSEQTYHRLAGGRDLYDRSATLRSIPKKTLKNPLKIIDWLYKNREQIKAESKSERLALTSLIDALQAVRKIPLKQTFHRLAGGRDLYDRSATLQAVPAEILKDRVKLIGWLSENRERIKAETKSKRLALASLIEALQAARKIPLKQKFYRLATGRSIYDRSPTLQAVPDELLNDPVKSIDWLHENREQIKTETGSDSLALVTLVVALQATGRLALNQQFNRLADGRDSYDCSPTLQSIPAERLNDPIKVIDWLSQHRGQIKAETKSQRLVLGTLVGALQAVRKIPLEQKFQRLAASRELYDRSPALRSVEEGILKEPVKLVDWLSKNLQQIKTETKSKSLALATLIDALQAAGRIPLEQKFNRLASGREYYDQTPVLHDGEKILGSLGAVIVFIDKRREKLLRRDKKSGRVAYATALGALEAAGRLSSTISLRHLRFEAAAADYARRFETMIKEKITAAGRQGKLDRSGFLNIRTGQPLSTLYIGTILKWAQKLYGPGEAPPTV
ncbi:MAG: hypothetical protein WC632_03180 [Candidatus Margulisiibacteriota bacterium]